MIKQYSHSFELLNLEIDLYSIIKDLVDFVKVRKF